MNHLKAEARLGAKHGIYPFAYPHHESTYHRHADASLKLTAEFALQIFIVAFGST